MYFPMSRWSELAGLDQEFEGLFSGLSGAVHAFPPVNVWTSENSAVVTAELPGMEPDDIELNVVGETLTLKGGRKPHDLKEKEACHRSECIQGSFSRSVRLPFRVDEEKVSASFSRGVLTIQLPRAEADKPRKIGIKAA